MLKNPLETAFRKPLQKSSSARIMVFELAVYGHHPVYIQYLVEYWCKHRLAGQLSFVVSPEFLQAHPQIVELPASYDISTVEFVAIEREEQTQLSRQKHSFWGRAQLAFQQWRLVCKYVEKLQATRCLILSLDFFQLPLALASKPDCQFSGIYFKPILHYPTFSNYASSWKEQIQRRREALILNQILRKPQLQTLFCLDPFAVKAINKLHRQPKAVSLPDPVQLYDPMAIDTADLKAKLQIEPDRQVFLLFGELTGRKGIYQLLTAIQQLAPELCEKLCLVIVGRAGVEEQIQIKVAVQTTRQMQPVQIIEHYQYVSDQEVQAYFQLSDVILAPYQKHVGMSGILLLAAAAQKPVLSSDYGLMGEMVRCYQLGLALDSTDAVVLAQGLAHCLLTDPAEIGNRQQMQRFAEENSADRFAATIFEAI
ncbi:glycosyltransferase [Phormidium tenue FACHB-886]|nr:glycosyltransferase [Phormidium tenue FACHB-886]